MFLHQPSSFQLSSLYAGMLALGLHTGNQLEVRDIAVMIINPRQATTHFRKEKKKVLVLFS